MIEIPTWEQARAAFERVDANPLELFVYHNEPAGEDGELFRNHLIVMIGFVCGLTVNAMDELKR